MQVHLLFFMHGQWLETSNAEVAGCRDSKCTPDILLSFNIKDFLLIVMASIMLTHVLKLFLDRKSYTARFGKHAWLPVTHCAKMRHGRCSTSSNVKMCCCLSHISIPTLDIYTQLQPFSYEVFDYLLYMSTFISFLPLLHRLDNSHE